MPTLRDNEVSMSYQTFIEITLSKAHAIWKKASKFDPKVYDIMQFIIQYADVEVLINRNPTLIIIWCR